MPLDGMSHPFNAQDLLRIRAPNIESSGADAAVSLTPALFTAGVIQGDPADLRQAYPPHNPAADSPALNSPSLLALDIDTGGVGGPRGVPLQLAYRSDDPRPHVIRQVHGEQQYTQHAQQNFMSSIPPDYTPPVQRLPPPGHLSAPHGVVGGGPRAGRTNTAAQYADEGDHTAPTGLIPRVQVARTVVGSSQEGSNAAAREGSRGSTSTFTTKASPSLFATEQEAEAAGVHGLAALANAGWSRTSTNLNETASLGLSQATQDSKTPLLSGKRPRRSRGSRHDVGTGSGQQRAEGDTSDDAGDDEDVYVGEDKDDDDEDDDDESDDSTGYKASGARRRASSGLRRGRAGGSFAGSRGKDSIGAAAVAAAAAASSAATNRALPAAAVRVLRQCG